MTLTIFLDEEYDGEQGAPVEKSKKRRKRKPTRCLNKERYKKTALKEIPRRKKV